MVFSSDYSGLPNPQIFVISITGGSPLRVTSDTAYSDSAPSWSADGTRIAFESHPSLAAPASLWEIAAPVPLPSRRRLVRH